ncbi:MAG: FAD-dependent oxidoreductase [marine bacterium B5-7]|nr:MAG: FAD-dependent oxidoreductase [marine bacterium B5-7]
MGGGVIGSAIACFLQNHPRFNGTVTVLEPDPTYRYAATPRSAGGIRHQFQATVNIQASLFATRFVSDPGQFIKTRRQASDLAFNQSGYLTLASDSGQELIERNVARQQNLGAAIELMDSQTLANRYSWLNTEDLCAAAVGLKGEGWIDPHSLLVLFRESAVDLGACYQKARAVAIDCQANTIKSVSCDDGKTIHGDIFINASGCDAADVCNLLGLADLPVRKRKRLVFVFDCRTPPTTCPLVVDPCGLYFRPEGSLFICGMSPPAELDHDCDDFEIDYDWFDEVLWPKLAHRVPAFEEIKLTNAWAGHYDVNTFDHNALIGLHPDMANFYLANGFSGHGLQQSPACGRGLAELIVDGRYTTLDLGTLRPSRIRDGCRIIESQIV